MWITYTKYKVCESEVCGFGWRWKLGFKNQRFIKLQTGEALIKTYYNRLFNLPLVFQFHFKDVSWFTHILFLLIKLCLEAFLFLNLNIFQKFLSQFQVSTVTLVHTAQFTKQYVPLHKSILTCVFIVYLIFLVNIFWGSLYRCSGQNNIIIVIALVSCP